MKVYKLNKAILFLIVLLLIDCALGGYIGIWRDWYWGALEQKHFYAWINFTAQFTVVALLSCWIAGYSQYLINLISLKYRTTLTRKALQVRTHLQIEGGSQRVQEDCNLYPQLFISLITEIMKSIIYVGIFSVIIVYQLGFYYLLIPIIYTVIGTLAASKLAKPLINLNYLNQVLEAKFRQILNKLVYKDVHRNNFNLFKKLKYLQYFQSFYSQITVIIPHVLLSFIYFSGKITFGVFMQTAASMGELINRMSFLIISFDQINKWLSCRKRLKEAGII